jgi:hypothetical protein
VVTDERERLVMVVHDETHHVLDVCGRDAAGLLLEHVARGEYNARARFGVVPVAGARDLQVPLPHEVLQIA